MKKSEAEYKVETAATSFEAENLTRLEATRGTASKRWRSKYWKNRNRIYTEKWLEHKSKQVVS